MRVTRSLPNTSLVIEAPTNQGHYTQVTQSVSETLPERAKPKLPFEGEDLSPSMREDLQKAYLYSASGQFACKTIEEAFARIQWGRALSIDDITAMREIYSVARPDGTAVMTMFASLMAALVQKSGVYSYKIEDLVDEKCSIAFFERGEFVGRSVFTMQDAARAGCLGKWNWKAYPRNMLFSRAMANGVRWYAPSVLKGLTHSPEELGVEIVDEIIEG